MKFTKILLGILFATLPLIHGRVFQTLGFDIALKVDGNFEFTKVMYFNLFTSVVFISFFIELFKEKRKQIHISYLQIITLLLLSISTYFSFSPFTSLIADLQKGHTFIMYANLLGIYIVLRNIDVSFYKKLIYISLFSGCFASILALKELYFPRFDYGNLADRAFGSFGHPNYLGAYLLMLIPFCSYFQKKYISVGVGLLLLIGIIASKSMVAIFGAFCYLLYRSTFYIPEKISQKVRYELGFFIILSFIASGAYCIFWYYPEKLHSFLSRFYLWETTLTIIFSDIKIFFFGAGSETLPYFFNSYKSPELYVFENYGYSADRPHNFLLNIWYHFGIFAAGIYIFFVYRTLKYISKDVPASLSVLLLFFFFGIFHFFSISSYLLIILSYIIFRSKNLSKATNHTTKYLFCIFLILSVIGAYFSTLLFYSQQHAYRENYYLAKEYFSHPDYYMELGDFQKAEHLEGLLSERNMKEQIFLDSDRTQICNSLVSTYPSVENYFYCGEVLEAFGNTPGAMKYYEAGVSKLPDLWNEDSQYWENIFIKNSITGNRFFSEKFSPLREILEKLEK